MSIIVNINRDVNSYYYDNYYYSYYYYYTTLCMHCARLVPLCGREATGRQNALGFDSCEDVCPSFLPSICPFIQPSIPPFFPFL